MSLLDEAFIHVPPPHPLILTHASLERRNLRLRHLTCGRLISRKQTPHHRRQIYTRAFLELTFCLCGFVELPSCYLLSLSLPPLLSLSLSLNLADVVIRGPVSPDLEPALITLEGQEKGWWVGVGL